MHRMCIFVLYCFLAIFFAGCVSQSERAYRQAKKSEDIESLSQFLELYPDHPNSDDIQYRLRVYEYRYIKKGKDPVLMRYFVKKYQRGRDVKQIKKILFNLEFIATRPLNHFQRMKRFYREDQYQKKIDQQIYRIRSREVESSNNSKKIEQFIKDYPGTALTEQLKKKVVKRELEQLLQHGKLNALEQFLNQHPELRSDQVKGRIADLRLKQFQRGGFQELERYIQSNPDDPRKKELEALLLKKRYQHYIAFYQWGELLELNKQNSLKQFEHDVRWFKEHPEAAVKGEQIVKELLKPYKISFQERMQFYEISENSLKESDLILKMPFFIEDLEPYLKKSESRFQVTQIATLLALGGLYNRDRSTIGEKIKTKLSFLKKLPQKQNILKRRVFLLFTTGDFKKGKEVLKDLMVQSPRDLLIQIMGHQLVEPQPVKLIELMLDHARDHDQAINSQKTIYKNKIDHYQELYWIDLWLNKLIQQRKGRVITPGLNAKIKQIRNYTKQVKKQPDPFQFWLKLEQKGVAQVQKLQGIREIDPLLRDKILYTLPFNRVHQLLKNRGLLKDQYRIFSIYLGGD